MQKKMKHSIKEKVKKIVWIFLSLLLAFNIMAETISTMLLPTVQVENVKEGEIESKLFSTGAISREDNDEITIRATHSGVIKSINYQSGDSINTVRPITIISTELSEEETKVKSLNEAELSVAKEGLERKLIECQQSQEQISQEIENKKAEGIGKDTTLIELEEKIKKLEQTVSVNKSLYEANLLAEQSYKDSESEWKLLQEKYEILVEQKQESYKESIKKLEESLKSAKQTAVDIEAQIKLYETKLTLNGEGILQEAIEVCSPVRGKVLSVQVYEGQTISKGEALFKVKPYSKLWSLEFEVTAAQAGYINVPQEVEWSVDKQIHTTKVTGKSNSANKGFVTISCDLEEEEINKLGRVEGDLESGVNKNFYISADVTITSTSGTYPTTVPNSALVKEHGLNYVYVIQKKEGTFDTTYTVRKVEVLVIKQGDYKAAVQGDISLEDQVVKNTTKVLEDDMEVLVE